MDDHVDQADHTLLRQEEFALLRDVCNGLTCEGLSSPASEECWRHFVREGICLWRSRGDSRQYQEYHCTPQPELGFNQSSSVDINEERAKKWDERWLDWLWSGFDIVHHHDEARDSSLLCRVVIVILQQTLGTDAQHDLTVCLRVLKGLRPNTEALRVRVKERVQAVKGHMKPY